MGALYAYGAGRYAYGKPIATGILVWAIPYVYGKYTHIG